MIYKFLFKYVSKLHSYLMDKVCTGCPKKNHCVVNDCTHDWGGQ